MSKRRLQGVRKAFEEKRRWHAAREVEETNHHVAPAKEPVVRRLAPNLDQLVIVSSLGVPPFKPGLVDRLLVLASLEDLPVMVVLNKIDLGPGGRREVEQILGIYRALGLDSLGTSTVTGEGVDLLRDRLRGKSSALTGHSGVGKSSLLHQVEPQLDIEVGAVSEAIGKGRHTTTEVRWYPLSEGGRIFDLPGLKLVPIQVRESELQDHFPELASAARGCRYRDCLHRCEPGCRVKEQVEQGLIAASRYASYQKLLAELA